MLSLHQSREKKKKNEKQEDKEMMMFVPEDKLQHSPDWWNCERYDYCDVIMKKEDTDNLFNRLVKKFSQLFA